MNLNITEDQKEQLEKEQYIGQTAQKAYDMYLRNYLDTAHVLLFNEFKECDSKDMLEIKMQINAIAQLETKVLQDIETGKMAKKQLGN